MARRSCPKATVDRFAKTNDFLTNHRRSCFVSLVHISAGPFQFTARFEEAAAPKTCARFRQLLPYRERIIHVRWSGEACWIPLGDLDLGLGFENHTSYPAPGQILLYPGGISETEICLLYTSRCV